LEARLLFLYRCWLSVTHFAQIGVAVGAGEFEEENAKQLAETRAKLQEALAKLSLVQDENDHLRARLSQGEQTEM
jgi:hypothetical protein